MLLDICPSVCLSHSGSMPKQFSILISCALHDSDEILVFEAKFCSLEFRGSSRTRELNRSTLSKTIIWPIYRDNSDYKLKYTVCWSPVIKYIVTIKSPATWAAVVTQLYKQHLHVKMQAKYYQISTYHIIIGSPKTHPRILAQSS